MTPLPYLAVIKLTGPDAASFLQAQLTADIAALSDGEASFAAYCSARGQVIGVLLVAKDHENWFVIAASSLAGTILQRFKMYLLRARVTFDLLPGTQIAGVPVESGADDAGGSGFWSPNGLGLTYALLGAPSTACVETTDESREWQCEELARGITWLQPETSERFIPQMLGLDRIGAVSFSKGCYPGQEVVARARYLGKVKRHPVCLEVQGELTASIGESVQLHVPPQTPLQTGVDTLANAPVEAVVIGAVKCVPAHTRILAVAALDEDQPLEALRHEGHLLPARRLPLIRTP